MQKTRQFLMNVNTKHNTHCSISIISSGHEGMITLSYPQVCRMSVQSYGDFFSSLY